MELTDQIVKFINDNGATISTVCSMVLLFVAKIFPNSNAPMAISKLQMGIDMVAKIIDGVGNVLKALSSFLSSLIKSDGFLGKK